MSYICTICGYSELEEAPWGDDGKTPSFSICDCCGVEFGYEDATEEGKLQYRKQWIDSGFRWFEESKKPGGWNPKIQLKKINTKV
jgi:hypothetical protein